MTRSPNGARPEGPSAPQDEPEIGWKAAYELTLARALAAEAQLSAQGVVLERVREALEPLAEAPDVVHKWNGSSHDVVAPPDGERAPIFNIKYGDIRRARSALSLIGGEGKQGVTVSVAEIALTPKRSSTDAEGH